MDLLDTLNDLMRRLENFLEASEAKVSLEKVLFSCILSTFCFDFLGKKAVDYVCFNKKRLRGRMTMKVRALQSSDIDRPSRDLEWPHATSRKLFGGL